MSADFIFGTFIGLVTGTAVGWMIAPRPTPTERDNEEKAIIGFSDSWRNYTSGDSETRDG